MTEVKKLIVSNSNNPSLQISLIKLDGNNYLTWSKSYFLFIKIRRLQNYIIDDIKKA